MKTTGRPNDTGKTSGEGIPQNLANVMALPWLDRVARARAGFGAQDAVRAAQHLGIGVEAFARILGCSQRKWIRLRNSASTSVLGTVESDRLLRFLRVFDEAASIFGTPDNARDWFAASVGALGGHTPLSLMDTDAGADRVATVLGRIQHGILS